MLFHLGVPDGFTPTEHGGRAFDVPRVRPLRDPAGASCGELEGSLREARQEAAPVGGEGLERLLRYAAS